MPNTTSLNLLSRLNQINIENLIAGLLLIAFGWLIAIVVRFLVIRTAGRHLSVHRRVIWGRLIFYPILLIFTILGLREAGLNLNVVLGAAGLFTVAIGFASQTSASNFISGLFLVAESPFSIGDVIQVDGIEGAVTSIDFMSVKLVTLDNAFIRIPNELLIKTPVINLTRFPIRRIMLMIGVSYAQDITAVREALTELAQKNPLVLQDPAPVIVMDEFAASSINLKFTVWVLKENYLVIRDQIQEQVKIAFDEHGIEIPFPQLTLHSAKTGSALGQDFGSNRSAAPF